MKRLLIMLLCPFLLDGCGSSFSTSDLNHQTQLLATSSASSSEYANVGQQLYVSYFGRPADTSGLASLEAALNAAGAPTNIQDLATAYNSNVKIKALIDSFGTSRESNFLYSGDTVAFVTAVFKNILNRPPQPAGLTFWVYAIDSGRLTLSNAALSIMAGALANTSEQGLIDGAAVNNKIAIASNFTSSMTTSAQVNAYKGAVAAATARTMLAAVTDTTNTITYQSIISSTIATLVANTYAMSGTTDGMTFGGIVLTNGSETITLSANAKSFAFPSKLASGVQYSVTIVSQPPGFLEPCTVGFLDGVVGNTDISNVTISCHAAFATGTILAGDGSFYGGSTNGVGTAASFFMPQGLAVDGFGSVYVADFGNNMIRKTTAAGVVTTLAGSSTIGTTDGIGSAASFKYPSGVAVDGTGNIYVADTNNHMIRKITSEGAVTTLAGSGEIGNSNGTGTAASFGNPYGLAVDATGNIYVADSDNNLIRKITSAGVVTTLAGSGSKESKDGTGTEASFNFPTGVAVDLAGNVYVAEYGGNLIRKITSAGVVTVFAGNASYDIVFNIDGSGTAASFDGPSGLAIDSSGNLYVADSGANSIRKISPSGVVTTFAGSCNPDRIDCTIYAHGFDMYFPTAVAVDSSGNLYVTGPRTNYIRKLTPL